MFIAEDLEQPYRELFVWAVVSGRKPLAMILWKECPDQIGSALVARTICKSLKKLHRKPCSAEELESNARYVIIFCYSAAKELCYEFID